MLKKIILTFFSMNNKESFQFRYYGEKIENNEMPANEIASSILALSNLLNNVNNISGNNANVELKIKGWKSGSFVTEFVLSWETLAAGTLSLLSAGVTIKDILDLVGITGGAGVIQLIKKIQGKIVHDVEEKGKDVIINYGDNNKITVKKNVYNIYLDGNSRQELDNLSKPISEGGINGLEVKYGDKKEELITEEDAKYFKYHGIDESEEQIEEGKLLLRIDTIQFNEGNKWRFSAIGISFWAKITDEKFNKDFGSMEFKKGDQLEVILKTIKRGDSIERIITKVISHFKTPEQTRIN